MASTITCSSSAFLSMPTPPHKFPVTGASKQLLHFENKSSTFSITLIHTSSSKLFSSSSPSSTPTVDEIVQEQEPQTTTASDYQDSDSFPSLRGCKACGREEIERGCNGEGRIQGGIATVPGFGWWPIKAYRPCPGFVAAGGRYRRTGQNMDDIGFGGGARGVSMMTDDNAKSSKKKQSELKT